MDGIVSLLDQRSWAQIEAIWEELERELGLRGARVTPQPHFSYQIAAGYDATWLRPALQRFAAGRRPFTVHTAGLGIFTGAQPILFLSVGRSPALTGLHEALLPVLAGCAIEADTYYSPEYWAPHITLAMHDTTPELIAAAVRLLAARDLAWQIPIDNLTYIDGSQTPHILRLRVPLGG